MRPVDQVKGALPPPTASGLSRAQLWAIQEALVKLGKSYVQVDGKDGPLTRRGIAELNRQQGIAGDWVSEGTLQELGLGQAGIKPESAPSGLTPTQIRAIQQALVKAGKTFVKVDGWDGPLTRRGISELNQARGLQSDQISAATIEELGLGGAGIVTETDAKDGPTPFVPPPPVQPKAPPGTKPDQFHPAPPPVSRPAPAPPGPVPPERSVELLGDSITANGGFANYLRSKNSGWSFQPSAVVGSRTDQMEARLRGMNLQSFKTLVLEGGVNDIASGRSVASIEQSLTHIFDLADQNGVRVVATTVVPWKGYPTWTPENEKRTEQLNDWIRTEAQRRGYPLADFSKELAAPGDPAAMSPKYRGPGAEGLLHPGTAGQVRMGEILQQVAFQGGGGQPAPADPAPPANAPPQARPAPQPSPAPPASPPPPAPLEPAPHLPPGQLPDPQKFPVAFFRALADSNGSIQPNDPRRAAVKAVQSAINSTLLTGNLLDADGRYGAGTIAGVKAFAEANHLPPPATDGVVTPQVARALATQFERASVTQAGFRLFNALSSAPQTQRTVHTPAIQEAARRLQEIEQTPDEAQKLQKVHEWLDSVKKMGGTLDMSKADPGWETDLQAMRSHYDEAAKVPGQLTAELAVTADKLQLAEQQRLDTVLQTVSQDLLTRNDPAAGEFWNKVRDVTLPMADKSSSPDFANKLNALIDFTAQQAKAAQARGSPARGAWDEMEASLLAAKFVDAGDGSKRQLRERLVGYLANAYDSHVLGMLKGLPSGSDPRQAIQLPDDFKKELEALSEAAEKANALPQVNIDFLQSFVQQSGFPPIPPDRAQAVLQGLQEAMTIARITTPRERAAFLAQAIVETRGFQAFGEEPPASNPNYFDMYDHILGNRGHPDGSNYRGRGLVQLTGRGDANSGYVGYNRWLDKYMGVGKHIDVVAHPEVLATDQRYIYSSAGYYWDSTHLNAPSEANNFAAVVTRLNGPNMNAYPERLQAYMDALRLFAAQGHPASPPA